jgi:predicted kinase
MPNGTLSEGVPRIVVLVGLPGSGKSYYVQNLGVRALSSDSMRELLIDDAGHQGINRLVFAELRRLLRRRLELRRPVSYIDATNLTPWERRPYVKLAELYGAEAEALFFDVHFDVCRERNAARSRSVPEDVLELMVGRMVAPSVHEGFAKVTRLG